MDRTATDAQQKTDRSGMKISVVMVTFNSARTIRYAIESFLAQTYRDAELVIVEGD